jgi:3-hydroxy-3-methylglutaryl CoA synthase
MWGGFQLPGEKAVANYDEDAVTMGVEACRDCIPAGAGGEIDRLYFSSTSSPYAEKQSSSVVGAVLDLSPGVLTVDTGGSLRCGTNGVALAMDAVNSGSAANALVCASDLRLGMPKSAKELEFGDGAAALLIGETDVVATIDHVYSVHHEIYDVYRPAEERFVRSWEDRFVRDMGYGKVVVETVSAALKTFGSQPKDYKHAVFYSPNPSYLGAVAKKLGFDPKEQAVDPLWALMGNAGSAHGFLLLAAALEKAKPGDRLLWVTYGDGCDVMELTTTDRIGAVQAKKSVQRYLAAKASTTYQKYLRWRSLIDTEPPMRPRSEPASAVALYRDRKCGLAFYGSKCRDCGAVQYPVQRICMECKSKDHYDYYPLANKQGKIATFSHDNLAVSPDPPTTLAAVDFEGGGRVMMDVTDRNPADIQVGMPLEMTFRKFRQTEGIRVYWWKSRPLR